MVRLAVAILVFLGGVALVVYALLPVPEARADGPSAVAEHVEVSVAGMPIALDADLHAESVRVGRAWLHAEMALRSPGHEERMTRGAMGARVDARHLEALLRDAKDPRSALRVHHRASRCARPAGSKAPPPATCGRIELAMPFAIDPERALQRLLQLKDDLDRTPADARINTRTREIIPERPGVRVDVFGTLDRIHDALRDGATTVEVHVETLAARRTAGALRDVRMDAILGELETHYDTTEKARERAFNLRIAAGKIDGLVVMPGEEFDFNGQVGERSEANGFRVAPVIAQGELVDGVGGGTCQIAGTLHGAAFFAGLPILERSPHTRPSYYIKLGLDAVVSYPNLNLRFRNDLPFPIVIGFTVEAGIARAEIRGAARDRMVTFVRRIDEALPFQERVEDDPGLAAGVRVLSQRGVPGFRLKRWRVVRYLATNQAFRQAMTDHYPPTTQIWRVGSGGPAPAGYRPPAHDDHPEYTADEFYSATQGPGIEGLEEVRRAGRTGTTGWTAAFGGIPVLE